jgi:hypothetical protein
MTPRDEKPLRDKTSPINFDEPSKTRYIRTNCVRACLGNGFRGCQLRKTGDVGGPTSGWPDNPPRRLPPTRQLLVVPWGWEPFTERLGLGPTAWRDVAFGQPAASRPQLAKAFQVLRSSVKSRRSGSRARARRRRARRHVVRYSFQNGLCDSFMTSARVRLTSHSSRSLSIAKSWRRRARLRHSATAIRIQFQK